MYTGKQSHSTTCNNFIAATPSLQTRVWCDIVMQFGWTLKISLIHPSRTLPLEGVRNQNLRRIYVYSKDHLLLFGHIGLLHIYYPYWEHVVGSTKWWGVWDNSAVVDTRQLGLLRGWGQRSERRGSSYIFELVSLRLDIKEVVLLTMEPSSTTQSVSCGPSWSVKWKDFVRFSPFWFFRHCRG